MKNSRIAYRYAKSLLEWSIELGKVDEVWADMRLLHSITQQSNPFLVMLKSPVISAKKKYSIIKDVTKGQLSKTTQTFLQLLTSKSREESLDGIIASFVDQYNKLQGIHKAKLTTALPVSDELKQSFIRRIKEQNKISSLQLETIVDESIIGGFVLEMDGKLVDASISRDLNDVNKQFQNNDYMHKLR